MQKKNLFLKYFRVLNRASDFFMITKVMSAIFSLLIHNPKKIVLQLSLSSFTSWGIIHLIKRDIDINDKKFSKTVL